MIFLIKILPAIVAVLYLITAALYIYHREYAWALVWGSYGVANIGLIILGMEH